MGPVDPHKLSVKKLRLSSMRHGTCRILGYPFLPPPPLDDEYGEVDYPEPLPDPPQITPEQLLRHVYKPSPYKAHGPDEIPNVVLQECVSLIQERLIRIYQAILNLDLYHDPWREFTTVVLRKPGKPSYVVSKAYRPIALLSTLSKVLTSLVAEVMSNLVETHQLVPKTDIDLNMRHNTGT
jgi:hypothetical protein